jgi:hypothetical protein
MRARNAIGAGISDDVPFVVAYLLALPRQKGMQRKAAIAI